MISNLLQSESEGKGEKVMRLRGQVAGKLEKGKKQTTGLLMISNNEGPVCLSSRTQESSSIGPP